jgi:hypothetical protein
MCDHKPELFPWRAVGTNLGAYLNTVGPGTFEPSFLIQYNSQLFLQWMAGEQCIQGFATGNAVFVPGDAAVGSRDQMLHARFPFRDGLFAEETTFSLNKHEAFELLRHERESKSESRALGSNSDIGIAVR